MRSRLQSIAFWLIWLAFVATVLLFIFHSAHAASRKAGVSQGAGAAALLSGIKQAQAMVPPVPLVVAPKPVTHFYTVTAISSTGLESAMSAEVSTTNNPVTLAWDAPAWTNQLSYAVHRGTNSGKYTQTYSAGTNLSLRVPPQPPTNLVITVAGVGFLLVLTNPPGFRTFKGKNMTISKRYQ